MSNTAEILERYQIPGSHEMDFFTLYNTFRDEPTELWDQLDGPKLPLQDFDVSQRLRFEGGRVEVTATYAVKASAGTYSLQIKEANQENIW